MVRIILAFSIEVFYMQEVSSFHNFSCKLYSVKLNAKTYGLKEERHNTKKDS